MPPSGRSSSPRPSSPPRVRDIARRFEQPGPVATKRVGKFRIGEHHAQHKSSHQAVRVGVVRKKSSLKKRSNSEPSVYRNESVLRKSRTTSEICPERPGASSSSKEAPTTCKTEEKEEKEKEEAPRTSLARPRGEKPQPPAKPARLLLQQQKTVAMPSTSSSSSDPLPSTSTLGRSSRPRCPPPAPPLPPSKERLSRIASLRQQRRSPTKMTRMPSTDDDIYEKLPSPEAPTIIARAEPAVVREEEIPRVPSMPPPPRPPSGDSDDCYEEILDAASDIRLRDVQPSTSTGSSSSDYGSRSYVTSIFCGNECSKKGRRPVSGIELDKLMKFKSDLQLNFSKKLGQLRQRVGERKMRSETNKCRVDAEGLYTDRAGLYGDDEYIYGDDWSSDEEENDRRSSMYKELEEQLNKAFPTATNMSATESDYESADLFLSNETTERPAELPLNRLSLNEARNSMEEPSPEYDYSRQYTSRLTAGQPLYQIYMLEEQEKLVDDVTQHMVVEEKDKSRRESSVSSDSGRGADCSSASALTSTTSMRRERLIAGSHFGSQRSLWCELPEVKAAGLLESLDDDTKLLQEAYFEVITSEASYLRSLNILITHFMASPEMLGSKSALSVISNVERKHLFSNIFAVRDCSERLLCDLETRLEENLVLDDVCDILAQHFSQYFDVYVKYCSNQVYQDRTLRRLKNENNAFLTAVSRLESDKQCQGLDMRSFLMLPMQRITRYPLLLYAILDRLPSDSVRYETASRALTAANTVVRECNEGARRMERTEQLLELERRIVYKDAELKRIPLVSNSRHLVKRGTLTHLIDRCPKGILQGRQRARSVHIFLFSDMLMITKKKLNGTYVCKDYCTRRFVDVEPIEPDNPRIPHAVLAALATKPHLFSCVLMRDARGRQSELLLSAESETDRERWLSALRPPTSANPEEKVYAEWDCPQAIVMHPYTKAQDDELDLQTGDMVNILRKMPDGWLYGERVRDGMGGWFPCSYVQQILNDHVRANNYRHRLRLIQAASGPARGTVGRSATPLMDRLRRMSNPRSYLGL